MPGMIAGMPGVPFMGPASYWRAIGLGKGLTEAHVIGTESAGWGAPKHSASFPGRRWGPGRNTIPPVPPVDDPGHHMRRGGGNCAKSGLQARGPTACL